jgi:hypothetical protein
MKFQNEMKKMYLNEEKKRDEYIKSPVYWNKKAVFNMNMCEYY